MAERLVRQPAERERLTLARAVGRSPSVLHGRVPAERHEHYTPDGELTGYTVVVREPEWTDDDRTRLLALDQYEQGVHECGFHWSLLEDPTNVFMPDTKTCPVCRGATRYARIQHHADDQVREQNGKNPAAPDPADGRHLFMRHVPPHEAEQLLRATPRA